ncbi:MAG: hypothetical protein WKF86_05510 [Acidimicrobiales bacterium]
MDESQCRLERRQADLAQIERDIAAARRGGAEGAGAPAEDGPVAAAQVPAPVSARAADLAQVEADITRARRRAIPGAAA